MSNSNPCFQSNPDITGIGVRSAVYAQNLLSFIPALFALHDGVVTQVELESLETQSTTIIISAFALLISTIVQAFSSNPEIRLSNFHATIILNLSWMNNTNIFIYFMLYVHKYLADPEREWKASPADLERKWDASPPALKVQWEATASSHTGSTWKKEMKTALRNPVLILGSAHLTLMAAVGIWFWHRPFSFGFAPSCSRSASVVVLGHQVSLTSEGLKGWSLFVYSLLLVPIFNLVVPVAFFSIPFFIWRRVENRFKLAGRQRVPTTFGLIVLVVINIIFLADTEVTLRENSRLVGEGDTDWTFGQTLALLLLLVPLRDITETLLERRPKTLGEKLLEASAEGKLHVVEYVYELGADAGMKDTSLRAAAGNGHRDVVRFLLENGADVNAKNRCDWTPLLRAASQGHSEVVDLLLKKGADIEAKDEAGNTPLIWAASRGRSEVVELLLENHPDTDARIQLRDIAEAHIKQHLTTVAKRLLEASAEGKLHVVEYLNELGADPRMKDTSLRAAAGNGHRDVVRFLLKNGAGVNARNEAGHTPLIQAASGGHNEVVKLLLKNNADIEAKDEAGHTPLLWAASQGHSEFVKLLLKNGARIEAKDQSGNTPLIQAASGGHNEVVELLLKNGADIEAKDQSGRTPLLWAAWGGHNEVVELLLKNGAHIEAKDQLGYTTPPWAAPQGRSEFVKLLLKNGADIEAKD